MKKTAPRVFGPLTISVSGPQGSGKDTVIDFFKQGLKKRFPNLKIYFKSKQTSGDFMTLAQYAEQQLAVPKIVELLSEENPVVAALPGRRKSRRRQAKGLPLAQRHCRKVVERFSENFTKAIMFANLKTTARDRMTKRRKK